MKKNLKIMLCELLGSLIYILFLIGSALTFRTDWKNGCGYLLVCLSCGIGLSLAYYLFVNISGGMTNPAVALSELIVGRIGPVHFLFAIFGEMIGTFGGYGILTVIFWQRTGSYFANVYFDDNVWFSLLAESILTFIIVFVFQVVRKKNEKTGIFALFIAGTGVNICGIQLTNCGLNPFRSLASAVLAGGDYLSELPVFLVSPFIASVVSAVIYMIIFGREKK